MQARRERGFVRSCADTPAGIMASSSGNAITLPVPRKKWRRDKCFLVRKCITVLLFRSTFSHGGGRGLDDIHAEWRAFHNAEHDIGKPVLVFSRAGSNLADGRH